MTLYWKVQRRWNWVQYSISLWWGRINTKYVEPFFMRLLRVKRKQVLKPNTRVDHLCYYHTVVCMHGPFRRAWLWHVKKWIHA